MSDNLNKQPTCLVYPLERRKIIKKTISTLLGWLIMYVIFGFLIWIRSKRFAFITIFIILFFVIAFLILIYQIYYYKFYFYDLKDDLMIIRKGVIGRTEANTQYPRIQNVFVDQDMLDRLFRLYDVHIITAGIEMATTHPLNHIDGLSKKNAEYLRDLILNKTKKGSGGRQGI